MSSPLGFCEMPPGFNLERRDGYWVWAHEATDRESVIHWNKWAVYKWAKWQYEQDKAEHCHDSEEVE